MSYLLAIDIGSNKICALVAQIGTDSKPRVVGSGVARSQGLKKGAIVDIAKAADAIRSAVNEACQLAGMSPKRAIVSVSGAYISSAQGTGKANIPVKEIELKDINRVMRLALDSAAMPPPEYEILHVLPFSFKVDEQPNVQDPVGMSGSRLETHVNIIIAQKSAMENLRKAIAAAGVEIENLVLSGYAASIAVLNEDEKELGACVIDIGASTCDLVVFHGNAPLHCDFFAVGSGHITSDLSISLHTPLRAAENIKIEHGSLDRKESGSIEIPEIGNESITRAASLETIANIVGARVEETLLWLANMLGRGKLKTALGAGVVLTGGGAKLEGLQNIAAPIFGNLPVRIARPKIMNGLTDSMRDPTYAVVLGLVRYGFGEFAAYEIDSTNNMRTAMKPQKPVKFEENEEEIPPNTSTIENPSDFKEPNVLSRIWNWLRNMF